MAHPKGRLIRKEDIASVPKLEVQPYPWSHFGDPNLIIPDNPRKSVLLERFHDARELAEKVHTPEEFSRAFGKPSKPLLPLDLTDDYVQGQEEMRIKRRKRLMDEDELVSFELAEMAAQESNRARSPWARSATTQGEGNKAQARDAQRQEGSPPSAPPAEAKDETFPQAPEGRTVSAPPEVRPHSLSPEEVAAAQTQAREEGFTAGFEEGRAEGFSAGHAEGFAAGQAEGLAAGKAEGEAQGLALGQATGETEARQAQEEKASAYFEKLARVTDELARLRQEVLLSGQEVFLEIAKVASEKILREQLAVLPASLEKLYRQAVESLRGDSLVALEMNPDDARRLKLHLETKGEAAAGTFVIRENSSLEPGDMQFQTQQGLLTVDMRRAVERLVDSLRGELFETQSSPEGSPDKAS